MDDGDFIYGYWLGSLLGYGTSGDKPPKTPEKHIHNDKWALSALNVISMRKRAKNG